MYSQYTLMCKLFTVCAVLFEMRMFMSVVCVTCLPIALDHNQNKATLSCACVPLYLQFKVNFPGPGLPRILSLK